MTKLKSVKLEVETVDGVQLIEWQSGEALARLMSDSVDLKTLVEMSMGELEAANHLRQLATAREASPK